MLPICLSVYKGLLTDRPIIAVHLSYCVYSNFTIGSKSSIKSWFYRQNVKFILLNFHNIHNWIPIAFIPNDKKTKVTLLAIL